MKTCYPKHTRKTTKTKKNKFRKHRANSQNHEKQDFSKKVIKTPGLAWSGPGRPPSRPKIKNRKSRKNGCENFRPSSGRRNGQAIFSDRTVAHWGPLRGGPSGEGACGAEVFFHLFFSPCVLVPLLLLSFPSSSCQSLLALVNPFWLLSIPFSPRQPLLALVNPFWLLSTPFGSCQSLLALVNPFWLLSIPSNPCQSHIALVNPF